MCRWIMFTQPLQDLFVMHEAMQRSQEDDVERQIANLLELKVSTQNLQLAGGATRLLKLQ